MLVAGRVCRAKLSLQGGCCMSFEIWNLVSLILGIYVSFQGCKHISQPLPCVNTHCGFNNHQLLNVAMHHRLLVHELQCLKHQKWRDAVIPLIGKKCTSKELSHFTICKAFHISGGARVLNHERQKRGFRLLSSHQMFLREKSGALIKVLVLETIYFFHCPGSMILSE